MMYCKKCDSPMKVILRKKDCYCENCFLQCTNHKFRACLGKNKVLSPNENVLICLSGGVGSAVLLDLVHHGISLENNKKLRIIPHFLHLFDDNAPDVAEAILKQCQKYQFYVYFVHLSDYLISNAQLPQANQIVAVDKEEIKEFTKLLNCMPPTAANDYLLKVKHNLFVKYAKQLNCNAIFTAETTNTLAINLLCNLAVGRGSQVHNDVGFCDIRDTHVKILRPMKDISKEELDYYVKIKKINPILKTNIKCNSLQSAVSSFVSDLQENFHSTISTVCKTADKIGNYDENKACGKCIICKSDLYTKDMKLSALEATNISRTVSFGNTHFKQDLENNLELGILDNYAHVTMFPLINKYLCYGCSRNHSEMSNPELLQIGLTNAAIPRLGKPRRGGGREGKSPSSHEIMRSILSEYWSNYSPE